MIYKDAKYEIDFVDFEEKLKNDEPKLFILQILTILYGKGFLSKDELQKIGELCLKYGVLVISDEIDRDLVFKDYIFHTFCIYKYKEFEQNSILCTSASKTFNIASLKASNIVVANKTK